MAPHVTTKTQPQPWVFPAQARPGGGARARFEAAAQGFDPISLDEMDGVALLDRTDTKFVLSAEQLLEALPGLRQDYRILEVNGRRLNRYRTLYFDTPAFDLYHAHANNRPERYKVRSREYVESRLSFLELKHKTRKGRTLKERISTRQPVERISAEQSAWLSGVSPLEGCGLEPKLWNTFTRLTLVSRECCERVTLDIDLAFATDDRWMRLEGVAIAEVKLDAARGGSSFLGAMRDRRIHPCGFSKYAVGTALLVEGVKKNGLKPRLLQVNKMMKGTLFHE